ncbi:MAG: NAD-glutamate dehydrogenase [Kineosporiaceae bacterium]
MQRASRWDEILERARTAVAEVGQADGTLEHLLPLYYRHVQAEDLAGRDPVDVVAALASHRDLAASREPGQALVRCWTPTVEAHGWSAGHTVLEIVCDDMPFLVDSVIAALTGADCAIGLVVHPVLRLRRGADGRLIGPDEGADEAGHAVEESWIHVEFDRVSDPARSEDVAARIRAVLDDVRVAVEDWPRMREQAMTIALGLTQRPPAGVASEEVQQAQRLLLWLVEEHFTFVGYREYRLAEDGEDLLLQPQAASGLGVLRPGREGSRTEPVRLTAAVRERARDPHLLVLTKANTRSTVHRPANLDYIGVKLFDEDGRVVGERRFLGLFSASAYTDSVRRIPVLAGKCAAVLDAAGFEPDSHSGKELLQILETYPRDELFQIDVEQLTAIATAVQHLQERRRTRLFVRHDPYGRFVSALVFLPRDRYTTAMRLAVEQLLRETFGAVRVDYTTRVSESVLARLHFVLWLPAGGAGAAVAVDAAALQGRLVEVTRSWDDDLAEALRLELGEERGDALVRAWGLGVPQAYKDEVPARVAVRDVVRLERLLGEHPTGDDEALATTMYRPLGAGADHRRFVVYRCAPMSLSAALPFLADLGVEVVDERPFVLVRTDPTTGLRRTAHVYDFGVRHHDPAVDLDAARLAFCDAFAAAWFGAAESDGFSRLVLTAEMTWRQVSVLRAYARYLRQVGLPYSFEYLPAVLAGHVGLTRRLVALFEARFDPTAGREARTRAAVVAEHVAAITADLDAVASLDHDRILRAFLGVITATVRTNAWVDHARRPAQGPPYLSFKLSPAQVPDVPAPVPVHEIFVYSPRVEGVHLRFGSVARGGLRWSDRREDFRTEILGLVKAQIVKNAVIVPTGAKGGFVAKRLPDPAVDRDAWLAEGVASYTTFIRGLLDLTDNRVADASGSHVVAPAQVVVHDEEDPYLVVAADKGTATFSDLANGVAAEYGFWLGDAFASGGSAGYDHKAMGITARGAWESVKRHFRERGVDVGSDPVTVVGIGDMSGDVFGNGMLLSRSIRLVAAFDHRHVFLDPDPDPQRSWTERARLFALPRSSWADYDPALLSEGGGVYPRSAKSVPISPQVAAVLGIADGVTAMTPADLLRAVLTAPVDLLWNGGIGTYVKASGESHAAVGDKANDAIRVDGRDLRVGVVGEGGNLGLTQAGRIEAALAGVRLNTDAIDNSAGVDCSDHEVLIKILLDRVVAAGDLTGKQRNALLAEMTDDVAALVLRDNVEQNQLLAASLAQAAGMADAHRRMLRRLEADGLDRALECLPTDKELADRAASGGALTSPELSVLVAHAKIELKRALLDGVTVDDPYLQAMLVGCFPRVLGERFPDQLAHHPLRREIVANVLANDMVNRGGATFAFRAVEETGASVDEVARAYVACREVFGVTSFAADVEALEGPHAASAQIALHLALRRLLDRGTRWFLQHARVGDANDGRGLRDVVERLAPVVAELGPSVPEALVGAEARELEAQTRRLADRGAPDDLAQRAAALLNVYQLLDVVQVAGAAGVPPQRVLPVYFAISDRFGVDTLLTRITRLDRSDRWKALARTSLRYDAYGVLESLTLAVMTETAASGGEPGAEDKDASPERLLDAWESAHRATVAATRATLQEVLLLEEVDLASLSVALRTLRELVRG